MIENTENTDIIATALPTLPELQAKVDELEKQLSWARDARDHNGKKLDEVRAYIQGSIDSGSWSDEELEEIFWEELADKLDLEISKTVEVEITARWTATVKMPRSMSFMNMTEHISISEPEGSSYSSVELDDVWEKDVDITEA
jgi:hypothetical protein